MRKIYSLVLSALTALTINAQVINGDMNHNTVLDVNDVTQLIDGYLTGQTEVVGPEVNHYYVDYNVLAGTWYKSKTESFTLNSDGTTDYGKGYTYKFLPSQGCILFFNSAGRAVSCLLVVFYPNDLSYIVVRAADSNQVQTYYNQPIQPVESITLSQTSLALQLDSDPVRLTATVSPADADDTSYEWTSSDEEVVTISSRGTVEAVGEGIATITCTALDGFGATATCEVTVGDVIIPTPTPISTHEAVDLGLSVKWATMNVGASAPEEYGDYFAWGETEPKVYYDWGSYKWCKGSMQTQTKYCINSKDGTVDNKTTLELDDDAAHVNWGGSWRMPTYEEINDLITKCTWAWTTQNDVNGWIVTSKFNGNSIFLPIAGNRSGDSLGLNSGWYWSSSLDPEDSYGAQFLKLASTRYYKNNGLREIGGSIRAVCE
ncbi:MAG: Ig-like domain-containing protein [Bacteroidaceae bacterium]|nr:Ig-like domain-containing protein [Bacteroidaceae bacterium]